MKKTLFLLALTIALVSCEKLNRNERSADIISGSAQKGYLVEGSNVTAIAYGSDMLPTGETFNATITGSLGNFSINVGEANADYFVLKAEGNYFDEVTGTVTDSPICLEAFVKSSDSKANLNLFTTITKDRIMKLVSSGTSYNNAKTQAQVEFLKTVNLVGADVDFTRLDVTGGSDADAMLLLTTCTIQNGRSASELTVILQKAASEFKEKGTFSEKTAKELFRPGQDLDFEIVFENLKRYYEENGLSTDELPSYWRYFYLDENATFAIISIQGFELNHYDTESSEASGGTIKVVSLEPFNVFSDVDWITVEKQQLEKEVFEVKVNIAENKTYERRVGHVIFSDLKSNELRRKEFFQGQAFPDIDPKISLKGKGTPGEPFLIECLDDLLYMRDVYNKTGKRFILSRTDASHVDASGAFFQLTSDIDLSSVCGPDKGDWIPIGMFQDGDYDYEYSGFDGTFNCWEKDSDGLFLTGQPGYTISGLYINSSKDYQGLFGVINGGTIRGLVVEGNVSGGDYVGLLAGFADKVLYDGFYNGGITDIATMGSVSGDSYSYAGGVLGRSEFSIENCVNYADVTGGAVAGGIVGHTSGSLSRCKNYGAVTCTSWTSGYAGGIVGSLHWIYIWDCGNYGNVSGSNEIGGIVGHTDSHEVTWGDGVNYYLINCYNNGDLRLILNNPKYSNKNHRAAGGIVGYVDGNFFSVKNCYSSGTVSFEEGIDNGYIGAICGEIRTSSSHIVEHNYWLQEGIPAIGGERDNKGDIYDRNIIDTCFRLTPEQMKGTESYNGVLYKKKDGKSFNTLLESLNSFLEDNMNSLKRMHLWKYSSEEPYPVLSKTDYIN